MSCAPLALEFENGNIDVTSTEKAQIHSLHGHGHKNNLKGKH